MNRHQRRAAKAAGAWIPLRQVTLIRPSQAEIERRVQQVLDLNVGYTREQAYEAILSAVNEVESTWRNDIYQAHRIPWAPIRANGRSMPVIQLSIRRLDRGPARDWRHFQLIKNQLAGPELEAVELYPAESRLVDSANQFHLWCVMDPLWRFPLGYHHGRTVSSASIGGSVNRDTGGEETISLPDFQELDDMHRDLDAAPPVT